MKKGFVVSAILYPLLVIALALIMGLLAISDNRRKILDNMKLEVTGESETDPEMSNSSLYYKMQALEEAYAELASRVSEERFEEIDSKFVAAKTYTDNAKNSAISTAKTQAFPVGSIYISTTSTNPSSYIGGTWVAYGQGRTLVGVGSNGTTNYAAGATGGSETHTHTGTVGATTLATDQIPSHVHNIPSLSGSTSSSGSHIHSNFSISNAPTATISWKEAYVNGGTGNLGVLYGGQNNTISTKAAGAHTHTITTNVSTTGTAGRGSSHTHSFSQTTSSNASPYIVVYFFKRTS